MPANVTMTMTASSSQSRKLQAARTIRARAAYSMVVLKNILLKGPETSVQQGW
jgi:hypothetical protein